MECHQQAGCYRAEDETGERVIKDTKENENYLCESPLGMATGCTAENVSRYWQLT